jgi:hypothetical protein
VTDFTVQRWDGANWVALGTVSDNNPVFAFNYLSLSSSLKESLHQSGVRQSCQCVCDARAELIRSAGRFVGKDYP